MTTTSSLHDLNFMRMALREARKGAGRTSPNPAVGAVIVSASGRVLARGHHRRAGGPHAEVAALRATRQARGATLYVTLEPCSTAGRTGACTDAILEAGIGRVVAGATDPNPAHSGRGLRLLRRAGVAVEAGVLGAECAALNRAFHKWISTGVPWVIAKAGLTWDGRISRPGREGRWITGVEARRDVQRLRATVDAILVGAGTVRKDDPRLTVRGVRGGHQPWRVVVAREGHLPRKARLFTDRHRHRTLIYRHLPLAGVLAALGRRGVASVLIEGGSRIHADAFSLGLVDEVVFYYAPVLAGAAELPVVGGALPGGSARLAEVQVKRIGADVRLRGLVAREPRRRINK